jgi:hypothetical protein
VLGPSRPIRLSTLPRREIERHGLNPRKALASPTHYAAAIQGIRLFGPLTLATRGSAAGAGASFHVLTGSTFPFVAVYARMGRCGRINCGRNPSRDGGSVLRRRYELPRRRHVTTSRKTKLRAPASIFAKRYTNVNPRCNSRISASRSRWAVGRCPRCRARRLGSRGLTGSDSPRPTSGRDKRRYHGAAGGSPLIVVRCMTRGWAESTSVR